MEQQNNSSNTVVVKLSPATMFYIAIVIAMALMAHAKMTGTGLQDVSWLWVASPILSIVAFIVLSMFVALTVAVKTQYSKNGSKNDEDLYISNG